MFQEHGADAFKCERLRKMRKVEQPGAVAVEMETSTSTVLTLSSSTVQDIQTLELLKMLCKIFDTSHGSSSEDRFESMNSHPSSPDSQSESTSRGVRNPTNQWQLVPETCRPLPDGDTCPPRRYYRSFWRSLTRRALNRL
jgi:hypothetical protein